MPKARRRENNGLPGRWRLKNGAYYYRVPPGQEAAWDGKKEFRLGVTLGEAHKAYGARVVVHGKIKTVADLLDRYAAEVVPLKAPKTRAENVKAIKRLRNVFGTAPVGDLKPHHVYAYNERRSVKTTDSEGKTTGGPVSAKREIEVLSHAFTKAVEWGALDLHPLKGQVVLKGRAARTRYVEDWEVIAALAIEPHKRRGSVHMIRAYIALKLLTGMSKGDLLRLEPARHFKDDGIYIQRNKTKDTTGLRTIYEWTPERRQAVADALAARPIDLAPYLFCTRNGKSYQNEETGSTSSFDTVWQNFMARVLAETKVTERFTEHDLRAKCASDADSLEKARALLSHADSRITQQVYRRKPDRV